MSSILKTRDSGIKKQTGATMVEYAILLTCMMLIIFTAVKVLGQKTNTFFSTANSTWTGG